MAKTTDISHQENNKYEGLVFTRLLYPKDEVVTSIWECFENKVGYEETLFWCYELYISGFEEDTMQILFSLYFCYVSFHNKDLLNELDELYSKWKFETICEEKTIYIHLFLQKIYNQKYSNLVKKLLDTYRQTSKHGKVTLFKGKKPKWLEDYDTSSRSLLHSISKQNIQNISHFLKIKEEKSDELEKIELALNQYTNANENEYLTSKYFQGTMITIIANIYPLLDSIHTNQTPNNTRHFEYVNSNDTDTTSADSETRFELVPYISTFEEYYPSKVYKILREQRTYKTRIANIDQKQLAIVQTKKTWQQCYYDDWLYYASFSPLWKNRIEAYDGLIDHKNQKVDFDDLEIYKNDNTRFEEFYNHYNLEPDEQPNMYVCM